MLYSTRMARLRWCSRWRPLAIFAFGFFGACSEDDRELDGGHARDAGDAAPERDASGRELDAAMDAPVGGDAAADSGSFACRSEEFPLWSPEGVHTATRVPLDLYCEHAYCPRTLAEYLENYTCKEVDEAGVDDPAAEDGGLIYRSTMLRSDGCGSVQFTTLGYAWPREFNFDSASGELIGAARMDDVGTELPGTPCLDAAYVAGTFRASCPSELLMVCIYH